MGLVEVRERVGEEDIAGISALAHAAEHADHHAPLGEHKWLDLARGGRAGVAGFVARLVGHERIAGYAQLSRGPQDFAVELVVHPAHRVLGDPVAPALLHATLEAIGRAGGGQVHLWVPKPGPFHDALATGAGLVVGRELYQMRRLLPLEADLVPSEVLETRPFRVGADEAAWLALNNRAFAAHPEQGAWDRATLEVRLTQPWFDPAGFLLHETNGTLAGFCWTKVHESEPPLGELYVLGVDPQRQGHGLGRRLLAAGLAHLEALGITTAMLYVDADNASAVALYRSFGFAVDHRDRAYFAEVPAAPGGGPERTR